MINPATTYFLSYGLSSKAGCRLYHEPRRTDMAHFLGRESRLIKHHRYPELPQTKMSPLQVRLWSEALVFVAFPAWEIKRGLGIIRDAEYLGLGQNDPKELGSNQRSRSSSASPAAPLQTPPDGPGCPQISVCHSECTVLGIPSFFPRNHLGTV